MQPDGVYRNTLSWHSRLNLLWLGVSWKWFVLLLVVLPGQVEQLVPQGEKNQAWGMIFAGGALWACIGPVLFGAISDRLGRRRPFISLGCAVTVLALAFLAKADSMILLAVGYLLLQVSDDLMQGAYASLMPLLVPEDGRGRSSAVLSAMNMGGQVVGAIGAIAVGIIWSKGPKFGLTSLEATYSLIALVQIICTLAVFSALRGLKEPYLPKNSKIETTFSAMRAMARNRDFMIVWFTRLLVCLGYYLIQPYLNNYLKDAISVEGEDGKRVFRTMGLTLDGDLGVYIVAIMISIFGSIAALSMAKRVDSVGRKKLLVMSGWVMSLVMIPFAFVRSFEPILALAVVFGFGYGVYYAASWAMATDVLPSMEDAGRDMGIWQSANTLVQVTPFVTGFLVDYLNRGRPLLGYQAAILAAAVFIFIGCYLSQKVQSSR